jgi:hypothetical protein
MLEAQKRPGAGRPCACFFVSTHGERQAKALASAARPDAMAELREKLIRRGAIYE